MSKFIFPLLVVATMFVADYAFGAGVPHASQCATADIQATNVKPRVPQ